MATCQVCGREDRRTAAVLSACADCIRRSDDALMLRLEGVHALQRRRFKLPGAPPKDPEGVDCGLCQHGCRIAEGRSGYCGVRQNRGGRLRGGSAHDAAVSWYYDPLPTNCVADWVCPAGTGAGYPRWAYRSGPETGYNNLAVFYEACSFDCLFCQNWHYRLRAEKPSRHSSQELAASVRPDTSCICFFGGDPTCQLPHALSAARLARRANQGRILRICWETNGSMSPALLDEALTLSLESGGCVKFDLKALDKKLHRALCGADNTRTLSNFATAAGRIAERPDPPPLVASTLLVPGYVDADEVGAIAYFIAGLSPDIPYALLGFHPDFLMEDLPRTSWAQAERCVDAAKKAGLRRVRIGNVHILTRGS